MTISPNGSVGGGGPASVSGYSILEAHSLEAAVELARGCPVTLGGASIEVCETVNVM